MLFFATLGHGIIMCFACFCPIVRNQVPMFRQFSIWFLLRLPGKPNVPGRTFSTYQANTWQNGGFGPKGWRAVMLEPWKFLCQNLEVSQGIPVIKDHEPLICFMFFQSGNTLPSLERYDSIPKQNG